MLKGRIEAEIKDFLAKSSGRGGEVLERISTKISMGGWTKISDLEAEFGAKAVGALGPLIESGVVMVSDDRTGLILNPSYGYIVRGVLKKGGIP
jgi:hypothetical protein